MTHIVIHRAHALDLDEAHQAAETLAAQLAARYEISYHWQDDLSCTDLAGEVTWGVGR